MLQSERQGIVKLNRLLAGRTIDHRFGQNVIARPFEMDSSGIRKRKVRSSVRSNCSIIHAPLKPQVLFRTITILGTHAGYEAGARLGRSSQDHDIELGRTTIKKV